MLARGLEPDFAPDVLREAAKLPGAATADAAAVRDLTDLAWCSIDNQESRDLDQLTVAQPMNAATRILVAIADVDALVAQHSAIDAHAQANTTSVYTAAQIFPMLPERLSTDLSSLAFDAVRLAIVVDATVNAEGATHDFSIYRAKVRNRAKLAYEDVSAWLEGNAPTPAAIVSVPGLDQNLRVQDAVARVMRRNRRERGALSLQTLEAQVLFSGDVVADVRASNGDRAKALIEDLMIAANIATATYLEQHGYPSVRRVLRTPKRWERIVALAQTFGQTLPETPDGVALERFLELRRAADPQRFPDLSLSIVKLLGSGEYMLKRPGEQADGHFGLAIADYAHTTAPNRRFADLVMQRLVKAALTKRAPCYDDDALSAIAQHCTEQEDNAAKVERQVRKSAAALLLRSRIGARFEGLVTGASTKGTWVRIDHPLVEGRVVRGYEGLDVGDRVMVQLIDTKVEQGFIDFAAIRGS